MSACYVTLAYVTWALAWEWALFIRAAKTITWALTREWAVAQDTTVILHKQINRIRNNLHVHAIAGAMHAPFII